MNICLAFFGQPRFVGNQDVYKSYKEKIIDRYNPTVFAHCWFRADGFYDTSSWSNLQHHNVPNDAPDIIKKQYNPRIIAVNDPTKFTLPLNAKKYIDENFTGKDERWNDLNYSNMMSQLTSIQNVADWAYFYTIGAKIPFDWIILCRYDTVISGIPDLEKISNDKFYLPGRFGPGTFPDTIQIFGSKYLTWARNLCYDIDKVYEGISEPTPEQWKYQSFIKRYKIEDLVYVPELYGEAVRK